MAKSKLPVEYTERLKIWRSIGWVELPHTEADSIWDRFEATFGFFGTGIREPVPSATWDIRNAFSLGERRFTEVEADLNFKVLRALTDCVQPGETVFALDWNHPCFRFDPRGGVRSGDADDWAVPVLPNGDHYVFLAEDFRFGIIGHMGTSICVFGEPLTAALAAEPPLIFTHLLRLNGQPIPC